MAVSAPLRFSCLCLAASTVASVELRGRRQTAQNIQLMQPEVVAQTLRQVEDTWLEQATPACPGSNPKCMGDSTAFQSSCGTVTASIVQGSSGNRNFVKEYMARVCGDDALPPDWHRDRCEDLARGLWSAMQFDLAGNREKFDSRSVCTPLWTKVQADAKAQSEKVRAQRAKVERAAVMVRSMGKHSEIGKDANRSEELAVKPAVSAQTPGGDVVQTDTVSHVAVDSAVVPRESAAGRNSTQKVVEVVQSAAVRQESATGSKSTQQAADVVQSAVVPQELATGSNSTQQAAEVVQGAVVSQESATGSNSTQQAAEAVQRVVVSQELATGSNSTKQAAQVVQRAAVSQESAMGSNSTQQAAEVVQSAVVPQESATGSNSTQQAAEVVRSAAVSQVSATGSNSGHQFAENASSAAAAPGVSVAAAPDLVPSSNASVNASRNSSELSPVLVGSATTETAVVHAHNATA